MKKSNNKYKIMTEKKRDDLRIKMSNLDKKGLGKLLIKESKLDESSTEDSSLTAPPDCSIAQSCRKWDLDKEDPKESLYEMSLPEIVDQDTIGDREDLSFDDDQIEADGEDFLAGAEGKTIERALEIAEKMEQVSTSAKSKCFDFKVNAPPQMMVSNLLNWIRQTSGVHFTVASSDEKDIYIVPVSQPGDITPSSLEPDCNYEKQCTYPNEEDEDIISFFEDPGPGHLNEEDPLDKWIQTVQDSFEKGFFLQYRSGLKRIKITNRTPGFSNQQIEDVLRRNPSMEVSDVFQSLLSRAPDKKLLKCLYDTKILHFN